MKEEWYTVDERIVHKGEAIQLAVDGRNACRSVLWKAVKRVIIGEAARLGPDASLIS